MWLARSKWREWLLLSWACWLDWIMQGLIDEELFFFVCFLFLILTGGSWEEHDQIYVFERPLWPRSEGQIVERRERRQRSHLESIAVVQGRG